MGLKLIACVIAGAAVAAAAHAGGTAPQTTRDKVYSKAQAARGAGMYQKLCASCHDPAITLPPGKEKGPELVGEKFIAEWQGRPLSSLLETTLLTMPNDASAVLSEQETADVIAYLLQANGHPEGATDLKYDAGKDIIIAR